MKVPFCFSKKNARLSELSLSFKLSHHQFITSVDVAEVNYTCPRFTYVH